MLFVPHNFLAYIKNCLLLQAKLQKKEWSFLSLKCFHSILYACNACFYIYLREEEKNASFITSFFNVLIRSKDRWIGNEWVNSNQKNTFARGYLVFFLEEELKAWKNKMMKQKNQVLPIVSEIFILSSFVNSQNSYHFTSVSLQVRINIIWSIS